MLIFKILSFMLVTAIWWLLTPGTNPVYTLVGAVMVIVMYDVFQWGIHRVIVELASLRITRRPHDEEQHRPGAA